VGVGGEYDNRMVFGDFLVVLSAEWCNFDDWQRVFFFDTVQGCWLVCVDESVEVGFVDCMDNDADVRFDLRWVFRKLLSV
jgi:hypothetical protein